MTSRRRRPDADARLIRRTAWRVGAWITLAASLLVVAVLVAAFAFVLKQVPLIDLLDQRHHDEMIDVGGLDVLTGAIVIGCIAVAVACALSLFATRRAVAPLVDALRRQRRFVADASHELRTPLAVLDARLQALERTLDADDPHREVVGQLRTDSHALVGVVNDLLGAVDVGSGARPEPVTLSPVLDAAVTSMRVLAADRGIRIFATAMPSEVGVRVPEASVHRALVALLDNAVKQSPPGSTITVTPTLAHRHVRIAIADEGGGIQGIEPERLFDRFVRAPGMAASGRPGLGIGLSLVQDTMGRYGGSVEVTRTSASGTTFTIALPRARARRRRPCRTAARRAHRGDA